MRTAVILALVGALASCDDGRKIDPGSRASLKRLSGTTFELVPAPGQYPYCLAFTLAAAGVIRQLTMSRDNTSYACPAGRPVGGHTYRVPLDEGPVKVQVLFSSQRINAASVAQQLLDLRERTQVAPIDLRLPGHATIETLTFNPEGEGAPVIGGVVDKEGVPSALDAGAP